MLTVVYDETCQLCRRCRHWLETQPTHVRLEFLAAGSDEARRRYGGLPWLGAELVIASAAGEVWVGPAAFLMALWATKEYRPWSYRLRGRAFAPMAEWFFRTVSSNRRRFALFLREDCPDGRCRRHGPAVRPADDSPQAHSRAGYPGDHLEGATSHAARRAANRPTWNA